MADMASSAREDEQVASKRGPRAGQPKRRTFTAAYKIKILERYDELEDPRERGALLRREGLYHSHIEYWRAARRRWRTSGCGKRTRNSQGSWPGPKRRWKWWEKHTRSWKCSPRARIQARGRASDQPGDGGAGAFAAGKSRLRAGRPAAVDAIPAAQSPAGARGKAGAAAAGPPGGPVARRARTAAGGARRPAVR